MKARDLKKYLNEFTRPSSVSPAQWSKIKSWAYAAHAGAVKGLHWSYEVEVVCPEQLEMFKDGKGDFVIPVRFLKFAENSEMSGYFKTLLNQSVALMENGLYEEADAYLAECELFLPDSKVVCKKRSMMFRLAAAEKLKEKSEKLKERELKIRRPKLYELRSRARAV